MPSSKHSLAILDDYYSIAEKHFSPLPNVSITSYPSTLPPSDTEALITRLKDHDMISTMRERTPFPSSVVSHLPKLKVLLTTGTRNASLDLEAFREAGVTVTGTKGHGDLPEGYESTTQHGLALMLALAGRIAEDAASLRGRSEEWQSGLAVALGGKTLGVVGLGKLGAAMARAAVLGLGMKVVAWSERLTAEKVGDVCRKYGLEQGSIVAVSKEELFERADVVSVHYVLSERSRGIIGREDIGRMKKSAFLVNTSRGPLVDEDALYDTLVEGRIAGAALDVYWGREPLEPDSRWRTTAWGQDGRARVLLSPHMGYVNEDTMETWYAEQAEEVKRFLEGREPAFQIA